MAAADFPTIYSCSQTSIVGCSTANAALHNFGFLASYVRLDNLGAVNLWINLKNDYASTTGFYQITTCSAAGLNSFQFTDPGSTQRAVRIAGIGVSTTSTVAGGAIHSVIAIG